MKRTLSILAALATTAGMHAAVTSTTGNVVTYTGGIASENRITTDTVWTNDMSYVLDGIVYVSDDATLTIEPGTLIKAEDGQAVNVSALVIARGSKIFAMGTASNPIVFTTIDDPITSVHDQSDLDDLDTGAWGGVVILGDGLLNSDKEQEGDLYPNIDDHVEGITANDFTVFGGPNNDSSQGIFRYVSIRHGGQTLEDDSELNGLTLGGVTDKTVIEFVEIFSNSDDSIEIFGGNVNPRFIVSAFSKDDSFDWDSGWEGYGQFWVSLGGSDATAGSQDHGAEMDGLVGSTVVPELRGLGTVYNATIVGPGSASGVSEGLFEISDDAGVRFYNSIFTAFGATDHVIDIKDDAVDGVTELLADNLPRIDLQNNIWFDFGAGTDTSNWVNSLNDAGDVIFSDASRNNRVEDPMLRGISRINDGGFDPRPAASSPAFTNDLYAYPDHPSIMEVDYQGAFGQTNWLSGWTKLSIDGYLPESIERKSGEIFATAVRTDLDVGVGEVRALGLIVTGDIPRLAMIHAEGQALLNVNVTTAASATAFRIYSYSDGDYIMDNKIWTNWAETDQKDAIESMYRVYDRGDLTGDATSAIALLTLNPGAYSVEVWNPDGTAGESVMAVTFVD
ncbi:hypothetical protein [Pelagicoccus sp. SDUM812002]|uniref:hypothetical protein n=1 Tax=Pelagicoccus sp. SDUM812002 TaxID=3041266 RepID=UPI00280FBC3C|nr:hypothetical protein [Pelagicoccus sp. SDUM812002]MDQ8184861.1 hypothetical protein [Pelagicoccus sp. SDUM812002]